MSARNQHRYAFFATCPRGLEGLLLEEMRQLGAEQARETVAGVRFSGDLSLGYRCCLWSRLANHIVVPIAEKPCRSVDDLYQAVLQIDWDRHLSLEKTFAIDFSGSLPGINHSHFGALKAKDAVADYFQQRYRRRPSVQARRPDVLINVRVAKGAITVSIDLSGESLHKRGYRLSGGKAPLKENLAAAILLRADWPGVAARGGALLDPMCGSGTLLIEGAWMAAGIAPGLMRKYWGFSGWKLHDPAAWKVLVAEAQQRREQALARQWPEIRGYDSSPGVIDQAQQNVDRAGLNGRVRLICKELSNFRKPTHTTLESGLIITNPPYGERLGETDSLKHLYRSLGQIALREFKGWELGVFTGNPDLGKTMGLRSRKQYSLYNGAIASKLLLFSLDDRYVVNDRQSERADVHVDATSTGLAAPVDEGLSPGAQMFANRLRKNLKSLKKWAEKTETTCYRLYDADMPEYAVAVDRYNDWVHVAEYRAPASVSDEQAQRRLSEVLSAIPTVLDIPVERVVVKQRARQRGSAQYRRMDRLGEFIEVVEGQARLLVNLHDYLDTGLFLDHRLVRMKIAELARGRRFLNLFCYTASATVHAALGGAQFTDSVDLSATYLKWAERNLALNGFSNTRHRLIRADVMAWIKACDTSYDLILLDPPTFSNSSKTPSVLDIQRDHCGLIHDTMARLEKDGLLIFSNNHRKFKLDDSLQQAYSLEEKTQWSLDRDFQRSKNIHQCWFIRHRP